MKKTISYSLFVLLLFGFLACENNTNLTEKEKETYLKKGKAIAQETFGVLSGQLQKAMKNGGVPEAIAYCNLAAYPLTDSLSKVHNAQIKRTSLKFRNPENRPTQEEKIILNFYDTQKKANEKLKPIVELQGDSVAFFAPINLNPLCLQCHGEKGASLSEENFALIKDYYPEDRATGYGVTDLRGIWSIKFLKN